jgi:protein-disulfide isomerase
MDGHETTIAYADGARQLGLDLDAFAACQEREDIYEQADRDYKDAVRAKIHATPGYIVDGERIEPVDLYNVIDARL